MFTATFTMYGCGEKTVTGPTVYDSTMVYDSTVVHDTTILYDTTIIEIPIYTPTTLNAYAIAQKFLEPEVLTYVENEYGITITSWIGHYSCLWNGATQIVQTGNTFTLAGTVTPLFTFSGDGGNGPYYDIIEYSDLVLVYSNGDPTDLKNWSYSWAASAPTFSSHGMKK